MEIVSGMLVADAFNRLEVMLACVRGYPQVAARDRRLMAASSPSSADALRGFVGGALPAATGQPGSENPIWRSVSDTS